MYLPLRKLYSQTIAERNRLKVAQVPEFLQRMGTLLKEGYTFADCVDMLLPYHVKNYEYWRQTVKDTLHNGGSPTQVLQLFGINKQYLVAIELAEATGQLAETLEIVAQQLEFFTKMKAQLIKLLTYPTILFIFLISLFIAFRTYFLPNISLMVTSRAQGQETSSIQWSKFFLHMPDYFIAVGCLLALGIFGMFFYIQRKRVDIQLNILFKLPVIGYFWKLILTRQFGRSLGNLLLTGFSLQQALEHLKQQEHQAQLAYVAGVMQKRIIFGDSLALTVKQLGYFFPKFEQFIAHGEASGLLGRELIIYCELLEARLQTIIRTTMAIIQPVMFIMIAACVIAAYLSILIPMYNLLDFI
ncbi:competence type IV pilus assembly protein ComGB [Solibacillus sp. FSL H8-0538]|uniref:competence type IV pilus assembly protein ComGB n=1 Tax=Solibacillus sp. FSL H8-0538 TaxID=2921400 RepID=UPI0030FB91BA